MKRLVYTCIAGRYDLLQDPLIIDEETKYICYTDQKFQSNIWEVKPLLFQASSPQLTARMHKTLAHLDETVPVMWQDGKIKFKKSQISIFKSLSNHDIALIPHPKRNCIINESLVASKIGKVSATRALEQVQYYINSGFPQNYGLFETAIIVRNQVKCKNLNLAWWHEISNKTHRDQISLPYLIWLQKINFTLMSINYLDTDLFEVDHKHKNAILFI